MGLNAWANGAFETLLRGVLHEWPESCVVVDDAEDEDLLWEGRGDDCSKELGSRSKLLRREGRPLARLVLR